MQVGLAEPGGVVDRHDHRHRGVQRHRVVRAVQHVGADLLRDQRQPGLLPREAAGRCAIAEGPGTMVAEGASFAYRSASARWQATASEPSMPASEPSAASRPST
jgi:hypothetical protein